MKEQILAVQRMQDYIGAHLGEQITLAQLARVSGFSPWHAHRIFREYVGMAPAEYIRRLRLSRSALRLRDERCRVLDVALDMGFGSVDGYQRAFRREFGCNPREYARSPVPLSLFTPYGVKYRELRRAPVPNDSAAYMCVQQMEKPRRRAVIRRGVRAEDYFAYCEEVGCEVWGMLMSMCAPGGEPVCLWLPERLQRPGTSAYVQGVEVTDGESVSIPDGFDVVELPAARYLVFQGEPFCEENYCQAIGDLQQAMDRYDPSAIGCAWDDEQPRIQLEPRGERGYIEMRAVKMANHDG